MENLQIAVKLASQAIESARGAEMMHREGFPVWAKSANYKARREAVGAASSIMAASSTSPEGERAFAWVSSLSQVIESRLEGV